jgi:hypothetical protein
MCYVLYLVFAAVSQSAAKECLLHSTAIHSSAVPLVRLCAVTPYMAHKSSLRHVSVSGVQASTAQHTVVVESG